MAENEIKALIRLLDDPDENVYKAVRKKIIAYGANILPDLTKAWQDAKATGRGNVLLMSRFEKIVPLLQNNLLVGLINDWKDNSRDLRHIAWLVSRFESFSLDKQKFDDSLDSLRDMIPAYNTGNFTPLEQIRIFNTAFFRQMGFKPVPIADYYNPSNCSPDHVINSKIGNPVSLALIYMILAKEVGLPVYGVNLPKNFILAYSDDKRKVDFYINPMSNGAVFERTEIDRFLQEINLKPEQQFYAPCDAITIIKRLLCRLEFSYRNKKDTVRSDVALKAYNALGEPLNKVIDWE
ncbi:MAG: transglutaminase family protein [Bacteroidales bacterium]|nr:transglutaminase family protein [Bacteroidales bacterium]